MHDGSTGRRGEAAGLFFWIAVFASMLAGCGGSAVSLSGRVVNEKGAPVPRAEVETRPQTDVVLTSSEGTFVLKRKVDAVGRSAPIPPGRYLIRVKKFGFDETDPAVLVQDGGIVVLPDLVLRRSEGLRNPGAEVPARDEGKGSRKRTRDVRKVIPGLDSPQSEGM